MSTALAVTTGPPVEWVWAAADHNVVDSQPAADWDGTPGPPGDTYDAGHVHRRTFGIAGRYEYHCEPHEPAGMAGAVVVE